MRRFFFILLMLVLRHSGVAQERIIMPHDTIQSVASDSLKSQKKWDAGIDLASRYIWRGQSWGGNHFVVQPSFNYALTPKWSIGIWGTTNFQSQDYENDGTTPKGYQEFDVGISYRVTDFLTIAVWDYYWPSFQRYEGVDTGYFNYGSDGVKSVDASLAFDFSEHYLLAFDATLSTLVGGNDFRESDAGPKRNFTTYIEAGYTFFDVLDALKMKGFNNITFRPAVGAVLNNQAGYYTYASYDDPSLVSITLSAEKEFAIKDKITIPLTLCYTYNASTANTEPFGKNFIILGLSFYY